MRTLALLMGGVVGAATPDPAFPVRIVDNGKRSYLADRKNAPFFFNCDIIQLMLNRLQFDDVLHYLDTRKAQGYTAIWFIIGLSMGMTDDQTFVAAPPDNAYGVSPFRNTAGDLSQPDARYFEYARRIVDAAADRGMMVGIAPAYVGASRVGPEYPGTQFMPRMKKSGIDGCSRYGEYVGRYFKDRKNVFWIHQGDQNAYNFGGADSEALVDAVVEGIRRTDNKHSRLHTAVTRDIGGTVRSSSWKAQFDASGSKVNPMPWLNVNHVYVKGPRAGELFGPMLRDQRDAWHTYLEDTNRGLPFFSVDGICENYNGDARANRAQGYYAFLSGALGYFTCNIRICWFMSPPDSPRNWKDEIVDRESVQNTYITRFFRSLPWWKLVPDTEGKLLTGGGEFSAAAMTHDGQIMVVYMPERSPVTVNLSPLAGQEAKAAWFNPRTGETEAAGVIASGSVAFEPPLHNDDDSNDWVLLLEAVDVVANGPGVKK